MILGGIGLGGALGEDRLCCGCRVGGKATGWSALLIWRLRADGGLFCCLHSCISWLNCFWDYNGGGNRERERDLEWHISSLESLLPGRV